MYILKVVHVHCALAVLWIRVVNWVRPALPSLLLLVLLNVTLFLKLSKIEHAAQSFYRLHLQEEKSLK